MTTEYHLQKRGLSIWHYVTWYSSLEECKKNFDKVSVEGNGNSWRMVSVEVIEEKLLQGERECLPPEREPIASPASEFKSDWGSPVASGWGKPAVKAAPVTGPLKSEHGSVGLIWVGDPVTKIKRRVSLPEAMKLTNEGWVKAGPRAVL